MAAYFSGGEVLDDPATLRRIAAEVGLDVDRVAEVLASSAYSAEVAADVQQARAFGANGVPFTVVDRRYGISGAQPVGVFEQTLRQAWADRTEEAGEAQEAQAAGTAARH